MYKSNPADVDTDGDARGPDGTAQPNPSLFDGQELSLSGTSPTLADTDGDGLTDYEEILGGGFNPRIADLPQLALELNGDPSLTLNAEKTQTQQAISASSTLQRDQTEQTKTDAATTQVAVENSTTIKSEAEVAFPAAAKVKVSGEMQFKESFSQEASSSWSDSSSRTWVRYVQPQSSVIVEPPGSMVRSSSPVVMRGSGRGLAVSSSSVNLSLSFSCQVAW